MARDTQSIVKMSRREGYALHPKAHKALAKRTALPGQNAQGGGFRKKSSQYALQLREKQKVKRLYGLLEKQFSNLMKQANKTKGQSGQILLKLLEQRADNVIYRAGFAPSRRAARQLVTHGHFKLNGRKVTVPSLTLKPGDELEVKSKSAKSDYFKRIDDVSPAGETQVSWIKVDRAKFKVKVTEEPPREETETGINEQLIVEYYSR